MARYTISILEYVDTIRAVSGDTRLSWNTWIDITNTTQLVFPDGAIEALSPEYRMLFMGNFILHYLTDEIGYESWPLFQAKLREKLNTYGPYITHLLELSEKELFTTMRVRRVSGNELVDKDNTRDSVRGVSHRADYVRNNKVDRVSSSEQDTKTHRDGSVDETRNLTDSNNSHLERLVDSSGGQENSGTVNETNKDTRRMSDTPQDELDPIESNAYLTEAEITDRVGNRTNASQGTDHNRTGTGESTNESRVSGGTINTVDGSDSESRVDQTGTSATTESGDSSTTDNTTGSENITDKGKRKTDWGREEEDRKLDYAQLMSATPVYDKIWPLFDDLFMLMIC